MLVINYKTMSIIDINKLSDKTINRLYINLTLTITSLPK